MSDEQVSEQVQASAAAPAETPRPKWGDSISPERQAELQAVFDAWEVETDHGERRGPLDGVQLRLTGADICWLAEQSGRDESGHVPNLHLEGANLVGAVLSFAHLEGANLVGAVLSFAHLEGANLVGAHLEGTILFQAHLEKAFLLGAHLEGAELSGAHLEGAELSGAHLKALLSGTHLEGAVLSGTHLEGATLFQAHLEKAFLLGAHLEGAELTEAHLEGATLRGAAFDKASRLNNALLTGTFFDQVSFDNTNLTVVDWSLVTTLGDERTARERKGRDGKPKTRNSHLEEYKAAVRANRVLSVNLQAQGLAEEGDRFAYQAQVLQRQVLRYQRKLGAYLFSWLLAGLAGYGYRLRRIFIVYGLAVLLFALGYFLAGGVTAQAHPSLQQQALDALQVSLNAIHGRVFFTQLGLDTLQSWLATLESIVGIVIEGVFVAMLIQRFFSH